MTRPTLRIVTNQAAPEGARCVRDLVWSVRDNEQITFQHTREPSGDEPPFYIVATLGEHLNDKLPHLVQHANWQGSPTPKTSRWSYRPLSSIGEIVVRFDGDPGKLADLYRLTPSLLLVSDKVMDLIEARDAAAVEAVRPTGQGQTAVAMSNYWVIMPCRVFDAIDISKSDVVVRRPDRLPGLNKFVTHVRYERGYVFSDSIPPEVVCFVEDFGQGWYWHRTLIEAARREGVRGLLFGYGQVRGVTDEIRLRGLGHE